MAETLRTGVVFGIVEAITPLIGWAAGVAAAKFVTAVDHWIAFGLLAAVGINMLRASMSSEQEEDKKAGMSFAMLIARS